MTKNLRYLIKRRVENAKNFIPVITGKEKHEYISEQEKKNNYISKIQ